MIKVHVLRCGSTTVDEALPAIKSAFAPDTAMLVKASHSMHLEKIVEELLKTT